MHRIARALHAHGHSPITGYACSHAIKGTLNLIYGVTATELAGRKQRLAACRGEARPWKGSQMAATPAEQTDAVKAALREIVTEHGPEALSNPTAMSNLLKDFLPDSPAPARMLVAAPRPGCTRR